MKFEDMINTIQHGDCYELIKQIPDKSIDLVYIDIPYLYCNGGSGTTCIAAKETNRRYIGMELDKTYHKIAMDRLNYIDAHGQTSIFTDFDNL